MISKTTAMDIALAYARMERAQELLDGIIEKAKFREQPDIRDAFGRSTGGLQLGVPNGNTGHMLFHVEWSLAKPILEAHIAQQRSVIAALSEKARIELAAPRQEA